MPKVQSTLNSSWIKMNTASAKLRQHIRKATAATPSFFENDTVHPLVAHLKDAHVEYRLKPKDSFMVSVIEEFKSIAASDHSKIQDVTPDGKIMHCVGKVMSMNTGLSRAAHSASKRQRPEDFDKISNPNGASTGAGNFENGESKTAGVAGVAGAVKEEGQASAASANTTTENANGKGKAVMKRRKRGTSTDNSNDNDVEATLQQTLENRAAGLAKSKYLIAPPSARLTDLAGLENVIAQVKELIFLPLAHPELYRELGVRPPCGVLLKGPSGCGKTLLADAIAGELGLTGGALPSPVSAGGSERVVEIEEGSLQAQENGNENDMEESSSVSKMEYFRASGPELIGGTSGESEERIRELFAAATAAAPSVLFLDNLDVIAGRSDQGGSQRGMDRRVVAQLLDCIDQVSKLGDPSLEREKTGEEGEGEEEEKEEKGESSSSSNSNSTPQSKQVVLICASNKPDSLDPTVRGRLSRELTLPVPDAGGRTAILALLTQRMKLLKADSAFTSNASASANANAYSSFPSSSSSSSGTGTGTKSVVPEDLQDEIISGGIVNLLELGKATPGYVGADLRALAREAGMLAVARITRGMGMHTETGAQTGGVSGGDIQVVAPEAVINGVLRAAKGTRVVDPETLRAAYVTMRDFTRAAKTIQPSAKREGFAVVPDVTWADVGALSDVREELLHNVLEPIAHPERFKALGLDVPAGVLFFGPPGCGKTLLAKAVANQSGANFISVKGPELLNMFVGESESRVRAVFSRARASSPCVIFFDELDALCPRRGGTGGEGGSGNGVSERVVNQLLTELDGLESRKDVYIIGATNRLELIDEAMLRPGRLGKLLYVPLPTADDREGIFKALTRKVSMLEKGDGNNVDGVDVAAVAHDERTEGFSGADCAACVREAGLAVMREWRETFSDTAKNTAATTGRPISSSSPSTSTSTSTSTSSSAGSSTSAIVSGTNVVVVDTSLPPQIQGRHFEQALARVRPSVSKPERERYDRVHELVKGGMGAIQALQVSYTTGGGGGRGKK